MSSLGIIAEGRRSAGGTAAQSCGVAAVEVATPIDAPILLVALDRKSLYLRTIRKEIAVICRPPPGGRRL